MSGQPGEGGAFEKIAPVAANSLRENIFDGALDVPSVSFLLVLFPLFALLILVAVLWLFVPAYVTHRQARYRRRLEEAYSRFEHDGPLKTATPRS
jgi:hypothetical protein